MVLKLKAKLEETDLPKAWAARQVGVTPEYFSRIMGGTMSPGADLVIKIKDLLSKLEASGLGKGA